MSNPMIEMLGRFPWSAGALLSLALVFALGAWLAADGRAFALQRAVAVEGLDAELRQAGLVPVRWSMETMTRAGQGAEQVEEQLSRWRESMAGGLPGGVATDEPKDRSEAFFALDEFRTRMRTRATELGIGLREGEQFGFASYTHEGPEERFIGAVHEQRRVIEFMLGAMFREPPAELRSVQRERPAAGRVADLLPANQAGAPSGTSMDYFTLDPRVSARVSGLVDGIAVRLVFVGGTATLRSFLTGIGGYGVPLIVRSVEVEGAGSPKTGVRAKGGDDWDDLSQFTVIVEHMKLVRAAP